MTFEEVAHVTRSLAGKISADLPKLDGLVGVSRGGWVPTRMLSSLLSVKRIYSIGLQYSDPARTQLVCYDDPAPFLSAPAVLLVIEDCLETGNALRYAKDHLVSKGHTVHTAALFLTKKSAFVPDFYIERLEVPPSFPWELQK